jgi:hypothetical protein
MRPWQDQIDVVTQENSRTDRPGLGSAENVYLLRPDGYVAVRGSVTKPDSLIDYLHQLFETTRAPQPAPASAPPA